MLPVGSGVAAFFAINFLPSANTLSLLGQWIEKSVQHWRHVRGLRYRKYLLHALGPRFDS